MSGAYGDPPDELPDVASLEAFGTYSVEGDRVRVRQDDGWEFVFGFWVFEDKLVLSQVPGEVSPTPMVVKPWDRVATP
jgi:hypothetical protein